MPLNPAQKLHLLREMIRIRRFEQFCIKQYSLGTMGGFLILTIGQEATPVAVRSLMGPDDHTITGVRGMAAALASGMSMTSIMAEKHSPPSNSPTNLPRSVRRTSAKTSIGKPTTPPPRAVKVGISSTPNDRDLFEDRLEHLGFAGRCESLL